VAALVIAAVTIFMLTGGRGFPWQRVSMKTRFVSAAGLKNGSPVRVAGIEVGAVTEVALSGEAVDVSFEVNESVRDRITSASVTTLGSVSSAGRERGRHHGIDARHAHP
jgi:phospholipid/cholesterol/gamma-HCH transport system substrate-binding protein